MNILRYGFRKERFKATTTRGHYPRFANYALIKFGKDNADAKRAWLLYILYIRPAFGVGLLYLAWLIEKWTIAINDSISFSRSLSEDPQLPQISPIDHIIYLLGSYWKSSFALEFIIPILFLFLALYLIFGPYPRPIRFNRTNNLVYTRLWGRLWLTDWEYAKIALWRARYQAARGMIGGRNIAIRLLRPDGKGGVKEKWIPIGWSEEGNPSDEEIGGDPSLAFWHWLDDFMKGKQVETPKVGRYLLSEKLCFLGPWFPKSIDRAAIKMQQKMQQQNLYPDHQTDFIDTHTDKLPKDPHFTNHGDFENQGDFFEQ